MLCMLEYQMIKQAVGEGGLTTHNVFIPKYEAAETAHDRVIREGVTKARGFTQTLDAACLQTVLEKLPTMTPG